MDFDDYGLYEIRNVRQDNSGYRLRWFSSLDSDLYIWEDPDSEEITRFQFYFNKRTEEQMIEWDKASGISFARVEEFQGAFKGSPTLQECDPVNLNEAQELFLRESEEVEERIKDFVLYILKSYLYKTNSA
ncbi:MAG: hypothetical protein D6748_05580 [Calditrichaeota bacterium]|nr:MAG: hypothetical protein D6748_05580 [Calditrichota bacterium]